jgi:hypothetical protein
MTDTTTKVHGDVFQEMLNEHQVYLGALDTAHNLATTGGDNGELLQVIEDEKDLPDPSEGATSTMRKKLGSYRAARKRIHDAIDRYHAANGDDYISGTEQSTPTQSDDLVDDVVLINGQYVPMNSIPEYTPEPADVVDTDTDLGRPEGTSDTVTMWVRLDLLPTDFDAEPSKELAKSLEATGLIHAIRLEQLPDSSFRVVSGRRRILAARQLGWDAIRAEVSQGGTAKKDELWAVRAALTENAVRGDNPIDEYRNIKRLQDEGLSEKDIFTSTGMPIPTIRRRLMLDGLVPGLWDKVNAGLMGVWAAEIASKFPASFQEKLAAQPGKLTGKNIHAIRRERTTSALNELFDSGDADDGDDDDGSILTGPTKLPWQHVAANALRELEEAMAEYGDEAYGFVGNVVKLRKSLVK